jgi:hypothetical protein
MHDAQVATLKAAWPVIVRSGNATQIIEALGKGEGLGALSGGLVPGSKPDPNVQRVAGGLYTGSAPTTSTVWSPGDTAGQQAEAGREIAVQNAKPKEPNIKEFGGQPYLINPDGSLATPQGFTPKPNFRDLNGGIVALGPDGATPVRGAEPQPKAPERQVVDGVVYERQPNGQWTPAQGIAPPAPKTGGPFADSNSVEGVSYRTVLDTANKVEKNAIISSEEARAYEATYNQLYGPKWTQKDVNGTLTWT